MYTSVSMCVRVFTSTPSVELLVLFCRLLEFKLLLALFTIKTNAPNRAYLSISYIHEYHDKLLMGVGSRGAGQLPDVPLEAYRDLLVLLSDAEHGKESAKK